MSLPSHVSNQQIVTNGNMTSTITSLATYLDESCSFSIQASFTGSPIGTIKIQASDDPTLLGYTDVSRSITSVNGVGTYMINVEFPAYTYVQLVYTPTSGSGSMNAKCNVKRR